MPSEIQVRLTWNSTAQDWVTFSTTGHAAGDTYVLTTQVADAVTSTGRYSYTIELVANFASRGPVTRTVTGNADVVVRGSSTPFGHGWGLAGLDQLVSVSGGVLWVYGHSATPRFFASAGGGAFTSPANDRGTLVQNGDSSYTYTAHNQVKWNFDSAGVLTSIRDTHNLDRTFAYDSGRVSTITERDGGVGTFSYDGSNLLEKITAPGNRVTTVSHDGSGDLTEILNPDGGRRTFTYDSHRLRTERWGQQTATFTYNGTTEALSNIDRGLGTTRDVSPAAVAGLATNPARNSSQAVAVVTDALNQKTTVTLDSLGRKTKVQSPDGSTQQWQRSAAGDVTLYIDGLERRTTFTYNGARDLTRIDHPDGSNEQFEYQATFHHVSRLQDTLNRVITLSYDSQTGDLLTVRNALNQVTTYAYYTGGGGESNGLVKTVTDPLNHTTTFQYDANRRLEAMIDSRNGRTTFSYDGAGNVETVKDALGRVTTFAHDGMRRLLRQTDAAGGITTFAYNALGQASSFQDPLGNTTEYVYDARGWLTAVKEAVGTADERTTTFGYDAAGRQTTERDARNYVTTFGYDPVGRLRTRTSPVGGVETFSYDAAGQMTAYTDALNHTTTFAYDTRGLVKEVRDALINLATMVYDTEGNMTTTVDPRGNRTTFTYDDLNRLIQVKDALNNLGTLVYDAASNVIARIDARGYRTTFSYDALHRPVATTDPLNHTNTLVYDAVGNVIRTIDALDYKTTFTYDALNRRLTAQDPGGGTFTTAYDAASRVVNTIDPLGNKTTFVYDALNRLIRTLDARNGTTTLAYDAVSNVVNVIDPVGNKTSFVYDALNRTTERIDPLGNKATFAYDAASRLTSTTDRLGRRRDFGYDDADRRTTETWKSDTGSTVNLLTFTYDANRNLLAARDNSGAYTLTYDVLNRVDTTRDPFGHTLTFTYDANGNRTRVDDSRNGIATLTYDAANRQTGIYYGGSGQTMVSVELTYTDRNQLATLRRYTGPSPSELIGESAFTYDGARRLTNLQHKNGSATVLANYTYTYDQAHRLETETTNGSTKMYTYDATHQLTNDSTTTFSYDLNGNRNMSGYTTGAGNRLTGDGVYTFAYDAEGNLTSKTKLSNNERWTYSYNHRNQMTGVEQRDSGNNLLMQATYTYDVFGQRIEKQVDADGSGGGAAVTTRFAYDRGNVWADLDGSNALQMRRLYLDGVDEVFARISSGGTAAWYLTDRLGSVRNLTDNSGVVQATYTYDGFGKATVVTETSGWGDRYKYTGRELDSETGLQYNRARYYDSTTGRWTSEDPIGFQAADANLYRYVRNASTVLTDASGLDPIRVIPDEVNRIQAEAAGIYNHTNQSTVRPSFESLEGAPSPPWESPFSELDDPFVGTVVAMLFGRFVPLEPEFNEIVGEALVNTYGFSTWPSADPPLDMLSLSLGRYVPPLHTLSEEEREELYREVQALNRPAIIRAETLYGWKTRYRQDVQARGGQIGVLDWIYLNILGAFLPENQPARVTYYADGVMSVEPTAPSSGELANQALAIINIYQFVGALYQALVTRGAASAGAAAQSSSQAGRVAAAETGSAATGRVASETTASEATAATTARPAPTTGATSRVVPRGGPRSCFPAGTPVHTSVGMKAIEQIAAGDQVWAYDHNQLRWAEREVIEVYELQHWGPMTTLQVKGETMRATGGHPFWVVRGEGLAERPSPVRIGAYQAGGRQEGRWVLARDLRAGDEVLLRHGEVVALESVRLDEVGETVYNFHVAELQNYAVGECGVLVHNTNDPPSGRPTQLDTGKGSGDTGKWYARPPGDPPAPRWQWDYEVGRWRPPPRPDGRQWHWFDDPNLPEGGFWFA